MSCNTQNVATSLRIRGNMSTRRAQSHHTHDVLLSSSCAQFLNDSWRISEDTGGIITFVQIVNGFGADANTPVVPDEKPTRRLREKFS